MSRDFVRADITFSPPADDPLLIANMDPKSTLEDFQAVPQDSFMLQFAITFQSLYCHPPPTAESRKLVNVPLVVKRARGGAAEMLYLAHHLEVLANETLKRPQGAIMKARANHTFQKQLTMAILEARCPGWLHIKPFFLRRHHP